MPEQSDQPEVALPFNVRENILDTGRSAALQLGRWEDTFALNAELLGSKEHRGASAFEMARNRFNDYFPLLRLGRIAEARSLLLDCREIFEREYYTEGLGKVLSALADVEDKAGHGQDAIDLERNALRYKYLAGEVEAIAVSHQNLGNYLARHAADHPHALAHHLAASLLRSLTGIEGADRSLAASVGPGLATRRRLRPGERQRAVRHRRRGSRRPPRPAAHPARRPAAIQGVFEALLTQARARADPDARSRRHLAAWDPVIAGITAARGGDDQARAAVEQHLTERQDSADWGKLAAVLRTLLHGEHGASLSDDLDEIDTAITRRALAALSGAIQIPGQLWLALPLTSLIGRWSMPPTAIRKPPARSPKRLPNWATTATGRRWPARCAASWTATAHPAWPTAWTPSSPRP